MIKKQYKRIVQFTAKELFELVTDVESYEKFLPGCAASRIIFKNSGLIIADLVVQFKIFKEQYRSEITFEQYKWVKAKAVSGPFHHLDSEWIFYELENGYTEISFGIDFEMNSNIENMIIAPIFGAISNKMLAAFEERACYVYKKLK